MIEITANEILDSHWGQKQRLRKAKQPQLQRRLLFHLFGGETNLRRDLELLHHSELKEHANAGFDEVEL